MLAMLWLSARHLMPYTNRPAANAPALCAMHALCPAPPCSTLPCPALRVHTVPPVSAHP